MQTLTADSGLWQHQDNSMRSFWQDHGDYPSRVWQLTVGSDTTTVIAWEASDKPAQLYVWILTVDNGLWHDQGDSMRSLWQDHSDYSDNRQRVLTRQCHCTSCLCQTIRNADLAYLITPFHAQTLLLSPWEHLVSTPRSRGKVEILR